MPPTEVEGDITASHGGVEEVLAFVRGRADQWCGACLLEGDYGDGKSHLLRLASREGRKAGRRAAYLACEVGCNFERVRELFGRALGGCGVDVLDPERLGPEIWFKLARTAKEHFPEEFSPKERKFIYDVGKYVARGWPLSERQRRWAESVLAQALAAGALEELNHTFRETVIRETGGPMFWAIDEAESVLDGLHGGRRGLNALERLILLAAQESLPVKLMLGVTRDLRVVLERKSLLGRKGVMHVRLPPLGIEEGARLAEVVLDVYELATGRTGRISVRQVREWVDQCRNRRAFIQSVVRYLNERG